MKKVLLDNCVHRRFGALVEDHSTTHCQELGWQDKKNGELLRAAASDFDVLLTVDRKMRHQVSLEGLDLGVVVAKVVRNRLDHLEAMLSKIMKGIGDVQSGQFLEIDPD